jgi:hypothetical protein
MSMLVNPISQPSLDISPIWTPVISEEVGKLLHSWSLYGMTGLLLLVCLMSHVSFSFTQGVSQLPPFSCFILIMVVGPGFCLSNIICSYLFLVPPFLLSQFVEFYLYVNTVWVTSSYLLRVICDWFSSAYLLRVHCVPVFFILFDLTTSVCPDIETSSFDWAHQSRYPPLLPDDRDRFQSRKHGVF